MHIKKCCRNCTRNQNNLTNYGGKWANFQTKAKKKKKLKSLIFTSFFKKHKNAILVFRSLYHWTTKNLIIIKTCYSTAFLFSGTAYWFILYVWHRLGGEKPHNKTIKIIVFSVHCWGQGGVCSCSCQIRVWLFSTWSTWFLARKWIWTFKCFQSWLGQIWW